MTLTRPWAIDAAFPNAADQRKQLSGIYPREGVFPDPITLAAAGIAFAASGWNVSARAFVAALKRGAADYSQAYGTALVSNDGVVTSAWTITAAPASGSRIDRLCIRARDTTQGDPTSGAPTDGPAGASRFGLPEFLVVTGTAATTPVAPALPAGYEEIAQVTTPAGAASIAGSTIINTYAFANVVGAPVYIRAIGDLARISNPAPGEVAILINGRGEFEYLDTQQATAAGWYQRGAVTRRHRVADIDVNNVAATLNFDTATTAPDSGQDFSYAGGVFTARRAGKYLVTSALAMGGAGAVVGYELALLKNGAVLAQVPSVTSTVGSTNCTVTIELDVIPGDTINARVFADIAPPGVGADEGATKVFLQLTHLW